MKKVIFGVLVLIVVLTFAVFADTSETTNPPADVTKLLNQLQKQVNAIPKLSVWAQVQYDFDLNAGTLKPDMGIWAEYNFGGFDFAAWYYGNTPGPLGGAPSSSSFQYYGSYTLPKMGDLTLSSRLGVFRIRKALDYLNYNGTSIFYAGSGSRMNYLALDAKIPNFNLISAINTTSAGSPLSAYFVGSANFSPVNMIFAAQNNFSKFNIGGQAAFDFGTLYAGVNMTASSGLQSWVAGGKVKFDLFSNSTSLTGLYYNGNFPNGGSGMLGELAGSMGDKWSYWADLLWSTNSGYSESQFGLSYSATDYLTIKFLVDNMNNDTTGYISYQFSF
ncbi:hypothetical protein [Athalassotoga saccharophila]|uniref:hypothetical protein n=1 Tax=Athalassotoga saccharophila TaxID=1441386 RepID=UPI001379F015|nr:hypothetical protein [Athalassotoga saccharophila]BBJ27776.1 hypothetical protein ATHSA_0667 [Athalassotoga saccharophila]